MKNSLINRKENFINKAKLIHKDENIDYSFVNYINNRIPVLLVDKDLKSDGTIYGEFWQTPSNHLKGHSHPEKKNNKISKAKRSKQDDIIERFKNVHKNENLDYSEVKYINMHTKVKIIDRDLKEDGSEYGEYWQEPNVHLKGCGHPLKGIIKYSKTNTSTTKEFIKKAKLIHKNIKYNYDNVNYINNKTKVEIICPIHGSFLISPDNFLYGKGCQKCGNLLSKAEDEISNIISQHYEIERNNRTILNGMEIDIYIPKLKIGIEYNGLRWHSDKFKIDKNYHLNKLNKCNEKDVKLIQIFEDEYLNKKELVINKILHLINANVNKCKISARKCLIKEIKSSVAKSFLNVKHIQGYACSTKHFGAYYNDVLVSVMSFIKIKNEWILTRFANDYNYICQGIGSKLFNRFIKEYNPTIIKSFADRRWLINYKDNLYTKLGFKEKDILKPNYKYYNIKMFGNKRVSKYFFNKKKFLLKMSNAEIDEKLKCYKIWDCGLIKYVWCK